MVMTKTGSPRGGVIFSAGKRNIPLSPAVKEPHMCRYGWTYLHECSIMSGHTHYQYVIMLQIRYFSLKTERRRAVVG